MSERTEMYQAIIDGITVPVASLTLEQAQESLCDVMDVIEKIDEELYASGIAKIISDWRNDVK